MLRRIDPILRNQRLDAAPGSLPQESLYLAKGLLDRVKFWRVLGQIKEMGTRRFACFFCTGHPMSRQVVHYNNMTALERRGEALFDVPNESRAVHSAFACERRNDAA